MPGKKTSSKKKKRSKRSQEKYPALKPELNLRSRYELLDYDYVDKLNDEQKAWLNKFTEEYVNANFDRENVENNLHNTRELISEIDARNYLRKTDAMTVAKASGKNVYLEDIKEKDTNVKDYLGEVTDNLNNSGNHGDDNT